MARSSGMCNHVYLTHIALPPFSVLKAKLNVRLSSCVQEGGGGMEEGGG